MIEFADGGELFKVLQKYKNFNRDHARFYIAQIVCCFEYLHAKQLIYRDLKPENILMMNNGYIKLSDFGFLKKLDLGKRTYTFCGTPEYLAPEILKNIGHGKPVDWYTLGILIYELMVGKCPFMHNDPYEIFKMTLT